MLFKKRQAGADLGLSISIDISPLKTSNIIMSPGSCVHSLDYSPVEEGQGQQWEQTQEKVSVTTYLYFVYSLNLELSQANYDEVKTRLC